MSYARLKDNYALRGFRDMPYGLLNRENGRMEALDREIFFLLELCNGKLDMEMVFLTPRQQDMLLKLEQNGRVMFSQSPSPIQAIQEYRKADNHYLRSVHWSVTGKCNLKCRHCYMSAPDYKYRDLSTEECMNIIDQMEQANVAAVSITGGEPFVREDIRILLGYLQQRGIAITQIYTNGLLLTEEILAGLKKIGVNPQFVLSFDGVGGHDWLRGKNGAQQEAVSAIRLLKEHGFPVMVETALYEKNIGNLLETYALLKELSVDYWKTSLIFPAGKWKEQIQRRIETEELYNTYLELIKSYIADGAPFSLQLDGFFACSKGEVKTWFSPYVRKGSFAPEKELCCTTCRIQPYLLPDGTLLPCATMTDSEVEGKMPNLREETISGIYQKPDHPFFKLSNMRTAEVLEQDTKCRTCSFLEKCRGGCRAMSLMENKGLYGHAQVLCTFFYGGYEMLIKETVEQAGKEG